MSLEYGPQEGTLIFRKPLFKQASKYLMTQGGEKGVSKGKGKNKREASCVKEPTLSHPEVLGGPFFFFPSDVLSTTLNLTCSRPFGAFCGVVNVDFFHLASATVTRTGTGEGISDRLQAVWKIVVQNEEARPTLHAGGVLKGALKMWGS